MDTKIKVPVALKAKVLLWTDVSYHDMEEINKMQSLADLESVLCRVFGVDLPEPKRAVLLELYVQAVLFCREHGFKSEQTSVLLSILKSIHEANIETPLNNIEQCFKYCKELLLCHSVRRPPFSINIFSSVEVNCVLQYIHNSYMRHFKLYKYIFTPQVKLDLFLTYSGIPDQDGLTLEGSSAPESHANQQQSMRKSKEGQRNVESVMEKEVETVPQMDSSPQTQEISIPEPEGSALGAKSELKTLIKKEVGEQMMLVSGQLDQQMKEILDRNNKALESLQLNHKAKK